MKQKPFTIGVLARAADVNIETIRYYQRIGLITEPEKPGSGYRTYPEDTLNRIKFIKRAQQLGFSLKEIDELLGMGNGNCEDVRLRAEQKQLEISLQIKDLQNLQATLNKLIDSCHENAESNQCAIIDTLTDI